MKEFNPRWGITSDSHEEIVEGASRALRAVLAMMGGGPFLFGAEPWSIDVVQFGTLSIVCIDADRNAYPNAFAFAASPPQACRADARGRYFPSFTATVSVKRFVR